MRIRPVRILLAAPLAVAALALTACGDKSASDEAAAEASATPSAAETDLVVEPAGPKVEVTLPETPMTNTPVEPTKAP